MEILKFNRDRIVKANSKCQLEMKAHLDFMNDVDACLKRIENGVGGDRDKGIVNSVVGRGKLSFIQNFSLNCPS